jgi:predicted transposase YdaD
MANDVHNETIVDVLSWAGVKEFISIVLQYILEHAEMRNKQAFFEFVTIDISPEIGSEVMTLAEQLRQEGKLENQLEIAKRLLAEKVEFAFISKITGLSLE